jgi:transaldolase/glucose-6-phosphate isomerase
MRVAIGSDHAGYELKEAAKAFLAAENCEVLDVGTHNRDAVDYADFAVAVGGALQGHSAERGIILCGSGVGASMAANRIPGVRAGLCHDTYSAHQGVEHDDMNVLVLGGRVVGVELAHELIHAFLNARFSGEARHVRRLAKMVTLENPLRALQVFGQSVWLDYIRRSLITSGELRRLIEEDGLCGVTSNPAIFEKAIVGSSDYEDILSTPHGPGVDAKSLYEQLAVRDVQEAADALRSVYDQTARRDGYVSLEVSPFLAYDTAATLDEGRRLWTAVDRENLMIKVPATPQGIPAVQQLITEGIKVNVTLVFSCEVYEKVAEAYIAGLERFAAAGGDLARVASVGSYFISRIDTAIESLVSDRLLTATPREQALLHSLSGKVAIAGAKQAYQRYQEIFRGARWQQLAMAGAQTQRLLWASTGTKNPSYPDVLYVEELIGPETINTIPPATFDAFRHHGRPRASLVEDLDAAGDVLATVAELGISMKAITDELLTSGVRLFSDSFEKLLKAVDRQSREATAKRINRASHVLPHALATRVKDTLDEWRTQGKVRRLWQGDATLWTGRDEAQWLGWLYITNGQLAHVQRFSKIAEAARSGDFSHILLLGMGGSSLGPEVVQRTFGKIDGFPQLHVLDSTDPAQIEAAARAVDLNRTLFLVSSKSGSTLEPNIFKQHFFERVVQLVGQEAAGKRFIAITDPHSMLQHVAEGDGFRRIFFGWQNIGGRYSALSDFGLVPAAAMGVDVPELLDRTETMVQACMPSVPIEENPGVVLGTILGVAAKHFGRDKVTIVASPSVAPFGAWVEQMLAESTGKDGKGLIPIDREPPADPDSYGSDRLFVYLRLPSAAERSQDVFVAGLEAAGQPVVRITLEDAYDLGPEIFRWEMATAVASAILDVNPFDQPDVEASKTETRKLVATYKERGTLPPESPVFVGEGVRLFTDTANADLLAWAIKGPPSLAGYLAAHLARLGVGDYFALLAYLEMNSAHEQTLTAIRGRVHTAKHVATSLAFGPRFLHSTGQAYKGGPNTGVFVQLTCDDAVDLPVPGHKYSFGVVKAAQARGDFDVLLQRGRRALRVHLGADVATGLATFQTAMETALSSAAES